MKGVVLAGGLGTRLQPLTRITNKHLLPVWDKPMIYYPMQMLVDAGITDIMLVTGGNAAGDFLRLIGNGEDFGLSRINYAYQKGEGGIAEALITTAAGLSVAIPALMFHRYFLRRVDDLALEMEQEAARVAEAVHGDPGNPVAQGA